MSSAGLFPEKFAMYFSTVNPLAGKIYSDIQAVEEAIKFSARSLSYNEKCAVVDKCLIHDIVKQRKAPEDDHPLISREDDEKCENRELFSPVVYDDPVLDAAHSDSLLLAVFPKKPEKYVFEESGFWTDEHSGPFSYCKESQARACPLGDLMKKLPMETILPEPGLGLGPNQRMRTSKRGGSNEEEALLTPEDKPSLKKEVKKKARAPSFFGVNVMGVSGGSQQEKILPPNKPKELPDNEAADTDEEESNLPKQKQNLELIAELQAKLNRNKTSRTLVVEAPEAEVEVDTKPKPVTADTVPRPTLTPTNKVNKPKAPPPPPPKVLPGKAVKVNTGNNGSKLSVEKQVTDPAPKLKTTEVKGKTKEKAQKQKEAKRHTDTFQKQEKEKEEFLVDVSSPCRIATPKTGFDFLDNW